VTVTADLQVGHYQLCSDSICPIAATTDD
jgi:hypothetical protein